VLGALEPISGLPVKFIAVVAALTILMASQSWDTQWFERGF